MKTRLITKFVFCSLLVFSLSILFYQNSEATAKSLTTTDSQEYTALYQSNIHHAQNDGSDKPSGDQCKGDAPAPDPPSSDK